MIEHDNPLLKKYEELYGKGQEEKKKEKIKYTLPEELKTHTPIENSLSLSACPQNMNEAFLQIAEQIKLGSAHVTNVMINYETIGYFSTVKKSADFSVVIYETP